MHRRDFVKSALAGWMYLQTPKVFADLSAPVIQQRARSDKKLIWILLRGAMDALHALPPLFEQNLDKHRGALSHDLHATALKIDRGFALHPAFKHAHTLYQQGQFLPVVAVASGYRQRSHFDGQDQMESGLNQTEHENGWLARAVASVGQEGLAVAQTIPIALRGEGTTNNWFPSQFKPADDDLLQRLTHLYSEDAQMQTWLGEAINSRDRLSMQDKASPQVKFPYLAERCGQMLQQNAGICAAMLEMGGWDTHNNQANRLRRQFSELDAGLAALQQSLGETWQKSVVIVTTEFGRTVKVNGTGGTDHGTASAMFLGGGGIQGKQVLGDWPGLALEQLYEQRDLKPTSDVRSWISAVLQQHWGLTSTQLRHIFPEVKAVTHSLVA
jgi:uncharacterized protein (DUF1501 family)